MMKAKHSFQNKNKKYYLRLLIWNFVVKNFYECRVCALFSIDIQFCEKINIIVKQFECFNILLFAYNVQTWRTLQQLCAFGQCWRGRREQALSRCRNPASKKFRHNRIPPETFGVCSGIIGINCINSAACRRSQQTRVMHKPDLSFVLRLVNMTLLTKEIGVCQSSEE